MAEKILIIDDDVDTLKLVGLMLQKQGYQIIAANNGAQGLELADTENPDLILLDVMMPDMDGYQVAKHLRANPLTANTPILMFTAKTQLDDKVTGFEAGADDYLTKPTHPSELQAHVKALLARSTKGRPGTTPLSSEKHALVAGIVSAQGGLGLTTMAVNLGDALRMMTKSGVIVAELRPGMGTLGPEMGVPNPKDLVELLFLNTAEMTRQKVDEKLYNHPTGLRLLLGSVRPKDAALVNAMAPMEALVKRLSYLAPYLILDFGAGLTPLAQKLVLSCSLVLVLVEPTPASLVRSKALIADLTELGVLKQNIRAVVNNRLRSEIQMSITQVEEQLEQAPLVAITPAPELMYMAGRMKTTAVAAKSDSVTAQQFAKLAAAVLDFEKRAK